MPQNARRLHLITQQFSKHTTSTIIVLLAFLQLKYQWIQGPNQSPFSTHPIASHVFISTYVLHYLACVATLHFPHHRLAHHLLVSSGYASVAALLSVFLQDSASFFVYAAFGLLSAAQFMLWICRRLIEEDAAAERWIRRCRILHFFNTVYGDLGEFLGQRILPRLPV